MCGQQLTSYATEFLQEVGLNSDQSFDINIGSVGMLFVGTMLVWVGMSRFGRRQVYIGGQVALGVILLVMGILGCIPAKNVSYGIGALLMLINFTFACTLGPSCYTIVAELPAADVRGPTVVLARASYVIAGIVIGQLVPRMMVQWGWGAKSAFFFLGADVLGATYCYFRLPESRGLTFGQLDVLFHNRVSCFRAFISDARSRPACSPRPRSTSSRARSRPILCHRRTTRRASALSRTARLSRLRNVRAFSGVNEAEIAAEPEPASDHAPRAGGVLEHGVRGGMAQCHGIMDIRVKIRAS